MAIADDRAVEQPPMLALDAVGEGAGVPLGCLILDFGVITRSTVSGAPWARNSKI